MATPRASESAARVTDLRSQVPAGCWRSGPTLRLTWRIVVRRVRQQAYEVQASTDDGFAAVLATSGPSRRPQVGVPAPGVVLAAGRSASIACASAADGWTDWSPALGPRQGY